MKYTQEQRDEIRRRWEAGESGRTIGKAMGIKHNAIYGLAYRMNLPVHGLPEGLRKPRKFKPSDKETLLRFLKEGLRKDLGLK